jgi:ABC-2 type transport system permease protein
MNLLNELRVFVTVVKLSQIERIRWMTPVTFVCYSILGPIFYLALIVTIYSVMAGGPVSPQLMVDFFLVAFLVNAFFRSILWGSAVRLYNEQIAGTLEILYISPVNLYTWMIAKSFSGIIDALASIAVSLPLAYFAFGFTFGAINGLTAVLSLSLTLISLYSLGFAFAGIGLILKQPWAFSNTIQPYLLLLSGYYYPITVLPGWLQNISRALPTYYGYNLARDAFLYGKNIFDVAGDLTYLAAIAVICVCIGLLSFKYLDRIIRKHGFLSTF